MPLATAARFDLVLSGTIEAITPTLIRRPGQKPDEPLCWTRIVAGSPCRVPVWPGETIKGMLRAAAFAVVLDAGLSSWLREKVS